METELTKSSTVTEFLRAQYLSKRKANSNYSMSAFARDVGLSQSFTSRLMNGERAPTMKLVMQVAAIFKIAPEVVDQWIANIVSISPKTAKISKKVRSAFEGKVRSAEPIQHYEIERFKAISQWYHLAILNLTYVKDFKPTALWISKRLGITRIEADDALKRLFDLGLLARKGNSVAPTNNLLFVETKRSELSVREYHRELSAKAMKEMDNASQEAFDRRYISGVSIALDLKRIPEFKEKLKNFQKEILSMAKTESYTDVYHLNLQFFPLTKGEK